MTPHARIVVVLIAGFLGVLATARPASAQGGGGAAPPSDLSGSWMAINHEDLADRVPGPYPADYTGLALNDEGRALALSTSLSRYSTIERQCALWSPHYLVLGPFGMKIWADTDPFTGTTIGWRIGAWEDRAETVIWLDGRPHPSANAPHTRGGFETGQWRGNTLTTRTTHIKAGIIRRNGAQHSDQTTLTTHYIRHGDLMTVVTFIEDPVYLSEPQPISKNFRLDQANTIPSVGPPCVATYEGAASDVVHHYLPGANPMTEELTRAFGIPREAALGGAETMYPEYRKVLQDVYVRPERCLRDCSGLPGR